MAALSRTCLLLASGSAVSHAMKPSLPSDSISAYTSNSDDSASANAVSYYTSEEDDQSVGLSSSGSLSMKSGDSSSQIEDTSVKSVGEPVEDELEYLSKRADESNQSTDEAFKASDGQLLEDLLQAALESMRSTKKTSEYVKDFAAEMRNLAASHNNVDSKSQIDDLSVRSFEEMDDEHNDEAESAKQRSNTDDSAEVIEILADADQTNWEHVKKHVNNFLKRHLVEAFAILKDVMASPHDAVVQTHQADPKKAGYARSKTPDMMINAATSPNLRGSVKLHKDAQRKRSMDQMKQSREAIMQSQARRKDASRNQLRDLTNLPPAILPRASTKLGLDNQEQQLGDLINIPPPAILPRASTQLEPDDSAQYVQQLIDAANKKRSDGNLMGSLNRRARELVLHQARHQ